MTTASAFEYAAREFEPDREPDVPWTSVGEMAQLLEPSTIQTPALDLIDEALKWAYETQGARLIISMPPQEGKSTRVTTKGPIYFLKRNPNMRIAIASYATDLANEFGRQVRTLISDNAGQDETLDLGLRIAKDNGAVSDWKLARPNKGGVRSVGIAAGLTGRPAEALFIDDPFKDMATAESKKWRDRVWSFWTSVAQTRLAPGAPVIIILTRWHHDDLAGRLLKQPDKDRWRVINIPAQADHDPNHEDPSRRTDPLGREPGEYMVSARRNQDGTPRSVKQWEEIKVGVGPRVWNALFQGRPTPLGGGLFIADWEEYEVPLWVKRDDGVCIVPGVGTQDDVEMCQSWDFTFKEKSKNGDKNTVDYVVGQVWLRIGVRAYLLHQVRARMSFTDCLVAMRDMSAVWPQAIAKFVEDKANGPAIINALHRRIGGIIPVEPEGSKLARAEAVAPFTFAKNIIIPTPEIAPWIGEWREEMRDFPNGTNDDQVDAFSQAINRLLYWPVIEHERVEEEDVLGDDLADYSISPW